jgi:hypothetical protein
MRRLNGFAPADEKDIWDAVELGFEAVDRLLLL